MSLINKKKKFDERLDQICNDYFPEGFEVFLTGNSVIIQKQGNTSIGSIQHISIPFEEFESFIQGLQQIIWSN